MSEQQKQKAEKPESIRQWYQRTTSKARMSLVWVSAISIVFGVLFFLYAPLKLAQFMQTANGAVTIPIAGGIWIAAFVYIFLVPSREVGFRSQESIEQTLRVSVPPRTAGQAQHPDGFTHVLTSSSKRRSSSLTPWSGRGKALSSAPPSVHRWSFL